MGVGDTEFSLLGRWAAASVLVAHSAAILLSQLRLRSYVGIDLMPEMIELARQRRLPNAEFLVVDAANLNYFPDASKDVVVFCCAAKNPT